MKEVQDQISNMYLEELQEGNGVVDKETLKSILEPMVFHLTLHDTIKHQMEQDKETMPDNEKV